MKPNWDDAPAWAQWLAPDHDGRWYWYEDKPTILGGFHSVRTGRTMQYKPPADWWKRALEERPK